MIHILHEGNRDLNGHRWIIPDGVRHHLEDVKSNNKKEDLTSNPTTKEAYDHLVDILNMERGIEYKEMKRIKNWFDKNRNATKTKQYELYGGSVMMNWVNNALNTARAIVRDSKKAKKAAGFSNAYNKTHEEDKQTEVGKIDTSIPTYNPITLKKQKRVNAINNLNEMAENPPQFNKDSFNKLDSMVYKLITSTNPDEISSLGDDVSDFCETHFGYPIGNGCGRYVYEIKDEYVIKISINKVGMLQNIAEYNSFFNSSQLKYVLPKAVWISEQGTILIVEKVNTIETEEEFGSITGVPFDIFCDYALITFCEKNDDITDIKYYFATKERINRTLDFAHLINNREDLSMIIKYICINRNIHLFDELTVLHNLGYVVKNGKSKIVILDNGYNEDVGNEFGDNIEDYTHTVFESL